MKYFLIIISFFLLTMSTYATVCDFWWYEIKEDQVYWVTYLLFDSWSIFDLVTNSSPAPPDIILPIILGMIWATNNTSILPDTPKKKAMISCFRKELDFIRTCPEKSRAILFNCLFNIG